MKRKETTSEERFPVELKTEGEDHSIPVTQHPTTPEATPLTASAALKGRLLRYRKWLYLAGLAFAFAIYSANLRTNPPGFYVDESSIAFNAHTISQNSTDEHGNHWPLYFRAFGEYKNPIYIYLLATVFKLSGPSILAARLLSVSLSFAAALLLGLLAFRLSRSCLTGTFVAATALLTPWLFEISRLVFEVSLYPLILVSFLLVLHPAHLKVKWSLLDSIMIAVALAFLTYTYSIGRLLAPLLAVGLIFFANPQRWYRLIYTWLAYFITLIPLFVFIWQNPGAFTERFSLLSYIRPESSLPEIVSQFVERYLSNLNLWNLLVTGDLKQRHHVKGMGSIFVSTAILGVGGIVLCLYRRRGEPWWRFVLYGLAVSIIPASLTKDNLHALRLVALPIFVLLLMVPALGWLERFGKTSLLWRRILITLIGLTLLQACVFQWQYHKKGPKRTLKFDAQYPKVFDVAVSSPIRPIYLPDNSYVHAYWYGVLKGMDLSQFKRRRRPPAGALVVSYGRNIKRRYVLIRDGLFIAYVMPKK